MSIPKHDELRLPILQLLAQRTQPMACREFTQPLAQQFQLTTAEIQQIYPSGNGEIFKDRISWALSYLNMSELVDRPQRGVYQLTTQGHQLLNTPEKIDEHIAQVMRQRQQRGEENPNQAQVPSAEIAHSGTQTPNESLYQSFIEIRRAVCDEILTTILSKTPYEFERLVLQLLQKMGYGGEIKNAGTVTQASKDGGIDGIIKEDVLGLGRIYIQAKRHDLNKSISRPDIQKFVGALAVAQSNKGVFITTCNYSKEALDYANNLNGGTSLVLIDGAQLAEYIYHYGLGMQIEQTLSIKKLDSDFWDSMTNEQ